MPAASTTRSAAPRTRPPAGTRNFPTSARTHRLHPRTHRASARNRRIASRDAEPGHRGPLPDARAVSDSARGGVTQPPGRASPPRTSPTREPRAQWRAPTTRTRPWRHRSAHPPAGGARGVDRLPSIRIMALYRGGANSQVRARLVDCPAVPAHELAHPPDQGVCSARVAGFFCNRRIGPARGLRLGPTRIPGFRPPVIQSPAPG